MARDILLCVDDDILILESLRVELRPLLEECGLTLETTLSGEEGLEILREAMQAQEDVVCVISDQKMPGMKGDEFLREVHGISPGTLKVLLTGYSDINAIQNAINTAELYRYIAKPWQKDDLEMTVRGAVERFRLKRSVEEKNKKIERLTMTMVSILESANYYNDTETGNHIRRVTEYSTMIAREAGFDGDFVKRISLYASLHDIGKVGVRQDLLHKVGKYTDAEFDEMKRHVTIGSNLLARDEIDEMAKNIVLYHHEHWDGKGYMAGLKGDAIPVEARIVAIADVFDALVTERVYKPALSLEHSMNMMLAERGTHFDPDLLDVFAVNRHLAYWIATRSI